MILEYLASRNWVESAELPADAYEIAPTGLSTNDTDLARVRQLVLDESGMDPRIVAYVSSRDTQHRPTLEHLIIEDALFTRSRGLDAAPPPEETWQETLGWILPAAIVGGFLAWLVAREMKK